MDNMQALAGLMQPQPQTQAQQIGGMFQGLGAAFQGRPDPRIAQQEMEMRQRAQLMQVQAQVDKQRQQKSKMQMDIGREFLAQDSPEAKKYGARILGNQMKAMGADPMPFENLVGGGKMTMDKLKQVTWAVRSNAPDSYLTKLGVAPEDIPTVKQMAMSDEGYKVAFGKSPQQEQAELLKSERDQRRIDVLEARTEIMRMGEERKGIKDERQAREADIRIAQGNRRLQLLEERGQRDQVRLDHMLATGPDEKHQKALDGAELFISQLQAGANALNSKGFLPPDAKGVVGGLMQGDPRALAAKAKRTTDPNDPDWVNFTKELKNQMVGYSRSVQNDIGPRAMQAFQGGIDLMENPPSMEAIDKVVKTMRQTVDMNRKGQDTAQILWIKRPDGSIIKVPWKRGMSYDPGDRIVAVE